jgi:hypothetical protein
MSGWIRCAPLRELFLTRVREFIREPEIIFWVYGFPVILAVGLGIAFRGGSEPSIIVGVLRDSGDTTLAALDKHANLRVRAVDAQEGRRLLAIGKLDILVDGGGGSEPRFVYDPSRRDAFVAHHLVHDALERAAGRSDRLAPEVDAIDEPGSRYIDFLMPGLLGMNLMGGGLYGVGFLLADLRVRKLLKRLVATPMRPFDFFAAILGSRLIFLVPEMLFLLGVATLGFGMPVRGSIASAGAVILLGGICFAGIGLLVGCRARKIETISGLLNVVMMPMWLLGGIFFTTERFPGFAQPLIQALPLTALNDALRAVILEGATLASQAGELAILAAWTAGGFLLGARWFRWV